MADATTVSSAAPITNAPTQRSAWGEWLLWLLLAFMTFTLPKPAVVELDASWRMALAHFWDHGYVFGRDAIFTYGPLGLLLGRTYTGDHLFLYIAWPLLQAFITATVLVRLGRGLTGLGRFSFFAFFVLFGVGFEDAVQAMLIVLLSWSLIRRIAEDAPYRAVAVFTAVFFAVLAVIKFTNLLLAGYVVVVTVAFAFIRRRSNAGWWLGGTFAATFLVLWSLCGQPISALPAYCWNSLEISTGYDAQMGLPSPAGPLWKAIVIAGLLVAYVAWHLRTQADRVRSLAYFLVLGAFLYLEWKHGFVRADGHMLAFFYSALLISLAFPALFRETGPRLWLARTLLVPAAILSVAGVHDALPSVVEWAGSIANEKLAKNIRAVAQWPTVRREMNDQVTAARALVDLPKTRALVGQSSIDVLGFEQGVAILNRFNYTARPIFQSYKAYTPRLARINADFFASPRAPEFVLSKLQTIDDRPLLADDARVLQLLPHYYRFVQHEKGYQLWRRRPTVPPLDQLEPRPLARNEMKVGEPWSLGEWTQKPLWVAVDLKPTLLGRARAFLYKPAMVHLRVTDEAGKAEVYRLPLLASRGGFLLNPLVTDFDSYIESQGGQPKRWVKSLTLEIQPEDRRFYQPAGFVTVYGVTPAQIKKEYDQQLIRAKYSMFSEVPDDIAAFTTPSEAQIDGHSALVAHAPSVMVFSLPSHAQRATGLFGYVPGAYENDGNTDGGEFRIVWVGETENRVLFSRLLQPKKEPKDRGLQKFEVDLSKLPPGGRLHLEITAGPHNEHSWDWTAWSDVVIQ